MNGDEPALQTSRSVGSPVLPLDDRTGTTLCAMINEGCTLSHAVSTLTKLLGFEGERRGEYLMTPDFSPERLIFDISHQPAVQRAIAGWRTLYAGSAAYQRANFRVGEHFCRCSLDKCIRRPSDAFRISRPCRPDVMMLERYSAIGLGPEGK